MDQFAYSPRALGEIIKGRRKNKKLNQSEVANSFKFMQSTISSIEQGAPGTRLETLFRLLAALDLEMVIRCKDEDNDTNTGEW